MAIWVGSNAPHINTYIYIYIYAYGNCNGTWLNDGRVVGEETQAIPQSPKGGAPNEGNSTGRRSRKATPKVAHRPGPQLWQQGLDRSKWQHLYKVYSCLSMCKLINVADKLGVQHSSLYREDIIREIVGKLVP